MANGIGLVQLTPAPRPRVQVVRPDGAEAVGDAHVHPPGRDPTQRPPLASRRDVQQVLTRPVSVAHQVTGTTQQKPRVPSAPPAPVPRLGLEGVQVADAIRRSGDRSRQSRLTTRTPPGRGTRRPVGSPRPHLPAAGTTGRSLSRRRESGRRDGDDRQHSQGLGDHGGSTVGQVGRASQPGHLHPRWTCSLIPAHAT